MAYFMKSKIIMMGNYYCSNKNDRKESCGILYFLKGYVEDKNQSERQHEVHVIYSLSVF